MKKTFILIVATIFGVLLSFSVLAHSGKTDSYGGHNSSSGYHYHHGYPAHQHTNGECPYKFDDKTNHNSSDNQRESELTTKKTSNKSENTKKVKTMELFLILTLVVLAISIIYIINLRGKFDKIERTLRNESKELDKTKTELRKSKEKITSYENELVHHIILKSVIEDTKAPKLAICGTPFLNKERHQESRYIDEARANYYLGYQYDTNYNETQKIITDVLGTEYIYTYRYIVECCFKHIHLFDFKFLHKEDIINELQTFLKSWLNFYPQLTDNINEDYFSLYLLIALSKNILLKGITEKDNFGSYKYRNNHSLTLEGQDLKKFMAYCYTELHRTDKITEKAMIAYLKKIESTFPDSIK